MEIQVPQHEWLKQPANVRAELARIFNLSRSTGVQMIDNRVITDGYTYRDLQGITAEKMRAYIMPDSTEPNEEDVSRVSEMDFATLYDKTIEKVTESLKPPIPEPVVFDHVSHAINHWTSKMLQYKEEAREKGMIKHLEEIINQVFELKKLVISQITPDVQQTKKQGRQKKA